MARDNDAFVHSLTSPSDLASPPPAQAPSADAEPSEEDVAAFDRVFAQFDPNGTGKVLMTDFLSVIDELDALRPLNAEPLLTEGQRLQADAFSSSEEGVTEMTRDQLFHFIKELTGNKIIIASPKKKKQPVPRKEAPASPTRSDASSTRSGASRKLTGISAKSQIRPPHLKRRTDLEKMVDGTTNVIADHEDFSAVPVKATAHAAFNKSRRNVTTPIVTSTPYPRRTTSPIGDPIEGYGMGPLSPTSPINSPPLRPQDWQDKRLQEYMSELTLQKEEELKRLQDQERQSNARLREQDILISELQEKLDLVEDALKDRKKELDKLRTNESRMQEIVRSMEKEVEARELELNSWRDRYHSVKRSYDEQLAEAEKLRDMILNKEGENNVLKEKINSLQEDIDTFIRVSWQFHGERQNLHNTIATLEADLAVARKAQHVLEQKDLEAKQLGETVTRLKFELDEMRKRLNPSEHGTLRSASLRSLNTLGRSESIKGKPEILANAFAKDERGDDEDSEGEYIETVTRTEKKKVRRGKERSSVAQVFNIEISDAGIQATPSTVATATQTNLSAESYLRQVIRGDEDEDELRRKIDNLADVLGTHHHLLDEMVRKSKTTESQVLTESAVIRKHGPPPPYEDSTTLKPKTTRWPKFLTISQEGEVTHTGWLTFVLWSVVLFVLGLTSQSYFLPRYDFGGLYPDTGYASTFEMFGQRHWWEKWNMGSPVGRMVWRFGWWLDEWLRGEGGWPS